MSPRSVYTEIKEQYLTAPVQWKYFILPVGILLFLIGMHYLICTRIISSDIIMGYIALTPASPSLSSSFFAHYMHTPAYTEHILFNVLLFSLVMLLIYHLWYLILPALKWNPPPHLLRNTFLCIFLLLPFPLSGIAIAIGRLEDPQYAACGFSGILAALLGFLFFLIMALLIEVSWRRIKEGKGQMMFLLIGSVVFLLPLWMWIPEEGWGSSPLCVHVGGYLAGVVIPSVLLRVSEAGDGRRKRVLLVMMGAVFVVLSLCWVLV